MAQANIHPEYHTVEVVMTNGKSFTTKSCYGKEGDKIKLDVDPFNHPAWKKDNSNFVNVNNDQVSKFKKKYGDCFGK